MVSPEHIDNQKSENQPVLTPVVSQQVPTEVEKKRPWLKPLMRVVGIVLSLIGSCAIWIMLVIWPLNEGLLLLLGVLLYGAVSILSALLFRSWWALLVILITFALGGFLASYLITFVIPPEPEPPGYLPMGALYWLFFGPIVALVGALIGTSIVKAWLNE